MIIGNNIDILTITVTKIDSSFPNSKSMIEEFSVSFRFDRNWFGGGVIPSNGGIFLVNIS